MLSKIHNKTLPLKFCLFLLAVSLSGCATVGNFFIGMRSPVYISHTDLQVYYVKNNLATPPAGLKHRVTLEANMPYRVVQRQQGIKYLRVIHYDNLHAEVQGKDTVISYNGTLQAQLGEANANALEAQEWYTRKTSRNITRRRNHGLFNRDKGFIHRHRVRNNAYAQAVLAEANAEVARLQALIALPAALQATNPAQTTLTALSKLAPQLRAVAGRIRVFQTLAAGGLVATPEQAAIDRARNARIQLVASVAALRGTLNGSAALSAQLPGLLTILNTWSTAPSPVLMDWDPTRFAIPAAMVGIVPRIVDLADSLATACAYLEATSTQLNGILTAGGAPPVNAGVLANFRIQSNQFTSDAATVGLACERLNALLSGKVIPQQPPPLNTLFIPQLQDVNEWLLAVEETKLPTYAHVLSKGLDWGALVVPLKLRPRTSKRSPFTNQRQYFSPELTSEFTAGTMLAYRFRFDNRKSSFGSFASVGLGAGGTNIDYIVGETALTATALASGAPERQQRWGLTTCVPLTVQFDRFNLGVAIGWDWLFGEASRAWIYQGKPWIGFGFGVSFLQGSQWNGLQ